MVYNVCNHNDGPQRAGRWWYRLDNRIHTGHAMILEATQKILNAYLASLGRTGYNWARVGAAGPMEYYACSVGYSTVYVDFNTATNTVASHFWE